MNGETHRMTDVRTPAGLSAGPSAKRQVSRMLLLAQFGLLAAFVGMSLVVIAAELWLLDNGGQSLRMLGGLALSGAILVALGWRSVTRFADRAERELALPVQGELPFVLSDAACRGRSRRASRTAAQLTRHARA